MAYNLSSTYSGRHDISLMIVGAYQVNCASSVACEYSRYLSLAGYILSEANAGPTRNKPTFSQRSFTNLVIGLYWCLMPLANSARVSPLTHFEVLKSLQPNIQQIKSKD